MDAGKCLCLLIIFGFQPADLQTISTRETNTGCTRIANGDPLVIRCTTNDFMKTVNFEKNAVSQGVCLANNGGCFSSIYQNLTQYGNTFTDINIVSYNDSEDGGNWLCKYDTTPSNSIEIGLNECPETTTEELTGTTEQSTFGSSIISTASSHSTTIGSGPETTTEELTGITEQSTVGSSIISTASSHSTTIGSGKNPTETVSVISTDYQLTTTNASAVSENKNVLVPLVCSIAVVSFCLVVISIAVICVACYKRYENKHNMSDDSVELSLNKRNTYQDKNHGDQKSYDNCEKEFLSRSKYNQRSPELLSDIHGKTIWKSPEKRYENNVYRVSYGDERGQSIQMDYLTGANYKNEESLYGRKQRQINNANGYRVYQGQHRYPQDRCYSYPNYVFRN